MAAQRSGNSPGVLGVPADEYAARKDAGILSRESPQRTALPKQSQITLHLTSSSAFSVYALASHIFIVKKKNVFCNFFNSQVKLI